MNQMLLGFLIGIGFSIAFIVILSFLIWWAYKDDEIDL
jgi:hypothetical protein